MIIDVRGGSELLDSTRFKDSDSIRHGHRFDLVVCYIESGCAEFTLPPTDFGAHFRAELRIQIRYRFIHEEDLRTAHHRPTKSNALRLTPTQLVRRTHEQVFDMEHLRNISNTPINFFCREPARM